MIGEVIEEITIQVPESTYKKISEEIGSNGSAGFPIELELVSLLEGKENSNYAIEISMTTPSGKVIPLATTNVNTGSNGRVRNRTRFNGLPIGGTGRHIVSITSKEGSKKYPVAEAPLFVVMNKQ
jgi:hypothetical protein